MQCIGCDKPQDKYRHPAIKAMPVYSPDSEAVRAASEDMMLLPVASMRWLESWIQSSGKAKASVMQWACRQATGGTHVRARLHVMCAGMASWLADLEDSLARDTAE